MGDLEKRIEIISCAYDDVASLYPPRLTVNSSPESQSADRLSEFEVILILL